MPVLSCRPSVGFRGSLAKEAKTWCLVCRTTFGKGKCFCNNKTSDVKAAVKPGTTSVERILEVCTKQTYAASPCALLAALCRIGTSVVCSGYNLITLTTTKEVRVSSFASAHKVCVKSFPPSPLPGPLNKHHFAAHPAVVCFIKMHDHKIGIKNKTGRIEKVEKG